MDQNRAIQEQPVHGRLQVGHLKREPDRPAGALARLYLVYSAGVSFVEQFQSGPAHIEYYRSPPILIARPELLRLNSETIAIEPQQAFVIAGGEGDTKFHDR